jgi:hypothetical protein
MPVPNTAGQLRVKLQDMQVGDFIVWATKDNFGQFGISTEGLTEIPVTGIAWNNSISNTFGYGIKVDRGLIVFDRVRQHSISWDGLNALKNIQGTPVTIKNAGVNLTGILRSLGGGCAYADENGNISLTDRGIGAWPTNNEWDKYIVKKDYGTGAGRDDVWHWNGVVTWTQDTPITSIRHSGARTCRGYSSVDAFHNNLTNIAVAHLGFRPVFEYKE